MKYILFEDFSGKPVPFIFPNRVDHADMREQMPYTRVISAGQVQLDEDGFKCFGGAPELDATTREEDAAIIRDFFTQQAEP
ncbi:hypothetical protein [Oleidesulfovibrio sp.]|uniref:hypothetical protein n=1 Tax=Oleidesulfovibrio sp. TaxID=2909707 RepID=UPI003A866F9F